MADEITPNRITAVLALTERPPRRFTIIDRGYEWQAQLDPPIHDYELDEIAVLAPDLEVIQSTQDDAVETFRELFL